MPPDREAARLGLCATCRFGRVFRSGKGVTYVSCERSKIDPRYPRFPTVPVLECAGFEEACEDSERIPNDREPSPDS